MTVLTPLLYCFVAALLFVAGRRLLRPTSTRAGLILLLLPLLFTGRALLTGRVWAPVDYLYTEPPFSGQAAEYGIDGVHAGWLTDPFGQMIPWQQAVRDSWSRGEWPLWNRSILSGEPLAAELQSAPYDPFNLIGLVLPVDLSLGFEASLTLFLAALGTFFFAREIGLEEPAALLAAAGYTLSSAMAFTIGWAPHTRTWAFLGITLICVRRIVGSPSARTFTALTVALALMVFCGHPESMLHVVGVGVAWALFELAGTSGRRRRLRSVVLAAGAGVTALLLTAISLLPFLDAVSSTAEMAFRTAMRGYHIPTDWHQVSAHAASAFVPFFGGSLWRTPITEQWNTGAGRVGSIILVLGIAGAVAAWRRRPVRFFAVAAIVCMFAALEAPPVSTLLRSLPLFDIAINDRLAFAAAFSLSILAGFALETARVRKPAFVILASTGALAIASALMAAHELKGGVPSWFIWEIALLEVTGGLIAAWTVGRGRARASAFTLLFGFLLFQRTVEDGGIYPALPRKAFYPQSAVLAAIDRKVIGRIVGTGYALRPNTSSMYGLEDVRGYEAMTFAPYADTFPLWCVPQAINFNRVDDLTAPFLSFLNVRYAITSNDAPVPSGWKTVVADRGGRLLENAHVLPRVFAPHSVRLVTTQATAKAEMRVATDYSDRAWILAPESHLHDEINGKVALATRRSGNGYAITASMERNGWLVISDAGWPGWRVYIDGHRVQHHAANVAFLGIWVPAGKHEIRVTYLPEAFVRGRVISATTLILCLAAFAISRLRPRSLE